MGYDEIGYWSEVKLEIIQKYAAAYSTILSSMKNTSLYHVYIDTFAGAGQHISKTSGDMVPGSPLNALKITPPFREYHLIDMDSKKVDSLRSLTKDRTNVLIYEGDCNKVLIEGVFFQKQDLKTTAGVYAFSIRMDCTCNGKYWSRQVE